ncbi:T9SS type B sorting domain-containing protein [Flavobacterium sp. RHBU_3]|uniref:T9SS type B sorting domain-containing protein n=1 Tax=Flavobacterium sp. RHBU_3 TaxID=3391184 RepID=UPI003984ADB3
MIISIKTKSFLHPIKMLLLLISLLCLPLLAKAQNINLQVSVTNETCAGNGMLSFSITGGNTSAPVNYIVYKLPNTTTPIANSTQAYLEGQQAGLYKVVATQVVNGVTYTDTEDEVEILSNITPLQFEIMGVNAVCGPDGTLTVTVTEGNPVSYEIISGPVTAPAQSSNVFNNVPAGFYNIKVTDACGSAPVVAYTLFSDSTTLYVSPAAFPDGILPDCDHITVQNVISHEPNKGFLFPISATFTVYPPDGSAPIIYTQPSVNSLDPDAIPVNQVIPFYYDTPYYYDLVITDPCGVEYHVPNNLVNQRLDPTFIFTVAMCQKTITTSLAKYVAPYTLTFTQSPPGFDPAALNSAYPGPFTEQVLSFGDSDNGVPLGVYEITVTDACGHTESFSSELEPDPEPIAISQSSNNDCQTNLGKIEVFTPPKIIQTIIMTGAPTAYTDNNTLPQDVSQYVNGQDGFVMEGVPPGQYTFIVTDECGVEYPPVVINVPEYGGTTLSWLQRPDCEPGLGTLMLSQSLSSVVITAAPTGYPHTLPHDVSAGIDAPGNLYLDGLLPGNYTVVMNSPCAPPDTVKNINLIGNEVTQNDFVYTPHCGSFDLGVTHTTTTTASLKFWLQREYSPGVWGHPDGSAIYDETTGIPNNTTAYSLQNNAVNYSLVYPTGNYRVLKSFRSFSSTKEGGQKECMDEIYNFSFYTDLHVLAAQNLTCDTAMADVQINVEGVQPFEFSIIKIDDTDVNISNGNSNIFTGLTPATYTVKVSDPCLHDETFTFNIANLPSLVTAGTAPTLSTCDTDGDGMETFDLSAQTPYILGSQDASAITVTYHSSLYDAVQDINPLPQSYTTGTTIVYARAEYNSNPNQCYETSSFTILVRISHTLGLPDVLRGCEGQPNEISVDGSFVSYLWSTGETTPSIYPEHAGTYSVTAIDSNGCVSTDEVIVTTTSAPVIAQIDTADWTDHNNTVVVYLENSSASEEDVEYSVDGVNWQTENYFTGLTPGKYFVYVRDSHGCGYAPAESVFLLMYPKFFTPNGDGSNETWRIRFASVAEPDLMVFIYDRYGKLITGFDTHSQGWDGMYNNAALPSTDYWFVVKRQNGKEYKGHFSLIR